MVCERLAKLEAELSKYSHDQKAIEVIQTFSEKLTDTSERQTVFSSDGAIMCSPIRYQDVLEKGLIDEKEDPFNLLQGDIISTDAAYFLGERLEGMKFAIASSTCDLIPGRKKEYAALLNVEQVTLGKYDAKKFKEIISGLLKFKSTQYMYLPRIADSDPEEVIANFILFDGIAQIKLTDLQMATRHASLSLIGWRIFGSLLRTVMVRAGDSEINMRRGLWVPDKAKETVVNHEIVDAPKNSLVTTKTAP